MSLLDLAPTASYPSLVLIHPAPLQRGDPIRVIAPAGPFEPAVFGSGLELLRSRFGLIPKLRADISARSRYLAGNDARRQEEWLEAVSDPEARAIWCARGGYGAMRLLPRLEAERLLRDPKWVIGFSDITAIHSALNQAGLVTLHGPNVTGLSSLPPEGLDHLEELLFGRGEPVVIGPNPEASARSCIVGGDRVICPGRASGPLRGGSLTLLAHLCGTRWQPRLAGTILFLEDIGEKPYRLDRYFTQLRLAGALDGVLAVAVGQLTDCDNGEMRGAEVLRELIGTLGVPSIEGIAAGHEAMNLALPMGANATLVAPGPGDADPPRLIFDPEPKAGRNGDRCSRR